MFYPFGPRPIGSRPPIRQGQVNQYGFNAFAVGDPNFYRSTPASTFIDEFLTYANNSSPNINMGPNYNGLNVGGLFNGNSFLRNEDPPPSTSGTSSSSTSSSSSSSSTSSTSSTTASSPPPRRQTQPIGSWPPIRQGQVNQYGFTPFSVGDTNFYRSTTASGLFNNFISYANNSSVNTNYGPFSNPLNAMGLFGGSFYGLA